MKESFNSALKISGLLSLGGVMIAGLFGAVVVFVLSLAILTVAFYVFRIAFPKKPITDEYDIREMSEKYMEFAVDAIGGKLPARVDEWTQLTHISYENETLTFRYSFDDSSDSCMPDKEEIRNYMIKEVGKKEAYGMLHVACIYLGASWSVRFRSQTTLEICESSLTSDEMKPIVSKWHEFGSELKWNM